MFSTFLDKASSLFDRRFVVAHWAPVFITLGLAIIGASLLLGVEDVLKEWNARSAVEQAWLVVGTLIGTAVIASVLQALNTPIVRLYEGYTLDGLPKWLNWLARWARRDQYRQREKTPRPSRPYKYPVGSDRLMPTRLGNVLTAAEEYPRRRYHLDAVVWWPRLTPLLQESFRSQIDAALTPMLALLNLSACLATLAVFGAPIAALLAVEDQKLLFFSVTVVGGLLLSYICYLPAVSQAIVYGDLIRSAFDLHRLDILETMCIPLPQSLVDERLLWAKLTQWIFHGTVPWYQPIPPNPVSSSGYPDPESYPFWYSNHSEPAPEPSPAKLTVVDPVAVQLLPHRQEHPNE
ncbi:MAG: hypothetical protein M3441_04140 [Chloroflexota bacterium]|nr:hypothetical protein [Chloroflexota bacterium]